MKGEKEYVCLQDIRTLKKSQICQKDGFEYVRISVLSDEEDGMEDSVDFDYVESLNSGETDTIDSVSLPEDYIANLRY